MLESSENSREIYKNDRRKLELLEEMGYCNNKFKQIEDSFAK